ncbi:hypothetical protein ACFSJU_11545 [Paradesertivirga mongoliensis]|uniref:Phytanoyl-CoA dioxygenase n=1 Tax=Paradesertivirga mongoliensis TaxID=2100740 RepID=A0ABW4ZLS5_9SPHI|nr:hypothetical protein [Pedobacter mongoliensis]
MDTLHEYGCISVRFPSEVDSGDTGWHVDAGFAGADHNDFSAYRINVYSKGRGLLMLFLFSDVGEKDAPTKILKSSHLDVARLLAEKGEDGLSFMELVSELSGISKSEEILAVGNAGTVYLCHPFLVHGAQRHLGQVCVDLRVFGIYWSANRRDSDLPSPTNSSFFQLYHFPSI